MDIYEEVGAFYESFGGEKCIIGKSVEGRDLYAVRVGKGKPVGISQYAMHAREWVTALLALEHARRGIARGSVWILPLLNPDGALLSTEGITAVSKARRQRLIKCNGSDDFSLWKANAEGVDLNVNFPARWGSGEKNVRTPASENYIGKTPLCAPESRALVEFTLDTVPDYTVSWHAKGEEIYWRFFQPFARRRHDRRLAKILSRSTGYPLKDAKGSAGGYKDWCIETLAIPAFTVEVGSDELSHPLGRDAFPAILDRTCDALFDLSEGI